MSRWREHDALVILGDKRAPRLPIFSVLIRAPDSDSMFLHHNFVSALLNDLFGVQTRGGCAVRSNHRCTLHRFVLTCLSALGLMRSA